MRFGEVELVEVSDEGKPSRPRWTAEASPRVTLHGEEENGENKKG